MDIAGSNEADTNGVTLNNDCNSKVGHGGFWGPSHGR